MIPATASAVDPLAPWREPFATEVRGMVAPVLVGCSGGADSVALLALAADAGLAPVAVHVDHALRTESGHEAASVGAIAARLGGDVRAVHAPVTAGPNLEARAREARYAALERARVELGAEVVLIGHTADDQAETVLLNVLRGSAGSGLAGMAPRHGHVVRPLLGYRREQTRALCEALGLSVLADPMNDDRAFRRVAIRHDVLPMLSALAERDLVPVLARQADILRSESEYLDALASTRGPTPTHRRRGPCSCCPCRSRVAPCGSGWARLRRRRWRSSACSRSRPVTRARRSSPGARGATTRRTPPAGRRLASRAVDRSAIGRVVVSEEELQSRITELGKQLTVDYEGRPPLLVGVLKGAFVFMSDLSRAIDLPVEFDFMAVSSYGSATRSSGVVRILKDLDLDLTDRHVLIVEDIVDSGLTLAYLRKNLAARGPASMEVCALLVKEGLQRVDLDLKYVGFTIPPAFVVGYGLDVGERYRNLPYVAEYAGSEPV